MVIMSKAAAAGTCCSPAGRMSGSRQPLGSGRPAPVIGMRWSPSETAVTTGLVSGRAMSMGHRIPREVIAAAKGSKGPNDKEEHKIFDEVVITVRSGKGGDGEISQASGGKMVQNHKYRPGSNIPKMIWLPNSKPADAADGGSVIIKADPHVDALTHLHSRQVYSANKGANGNPAMGSSGPKSQSTRSRYNNRTEPLRISVPPGTEVRKKRGNFMIGELLQPGDSLVVARGGRGGLGVVAPSREQKIRKAATARNRAAAEGYEEEVVEDANWREDSYGEKGEELSLRLILRVVADVGIVGLPNAAGDGAPVLADLPGLIEGAHQGRGLGFMFLRHLRRTRVLMHVVDAADVDPVTDYWTVREELRMYNPEYTARPHIVVLNKMDMEDAYELEEELRVGILAMSNKLSEENDGQPSLPTEIVSTSAVTGNGIDDLNAALRKALGLKDKDEDLDEMLAIDPEILAALKADGIDVDQLDFSDI